MKGFYTCHSWSGQTRLGGGGGDFRYWHGEYDASAGTYPQQIFTGKETGDAQTRHLVLSYYVISGCQNNKIYNINISHLCRAGVAGYWQSNIYIYKHLQILILSLLNMD